MTHHRYDPWLPPQLQHLLRGQGRTEGAVGVEPKVGLQCVVHDNVCDHDGRDKELAGVEGGPGIPHLRVVGVFWGFEDCKQVSTVPATEVLPWRADRCPGRDGNVPIAADDRGGG